MGILSKSDTIDVGIGLLLPTSKVGNLYFIFILDERNQLWYVDKDEFSYNRVELSYPVVLFKKGDNFRAYNVKFCNFTPTLNKCSSRLNISEGKPYAGIQSDDFFLRGFEIRTSELFYSDYGVIIFSYYKPYLKSTLNRPLEYRLFIFDEKKRLYHQVNLQYARVISTLLSKQSTMKLPVDGKSIYDIYKLVQGFNPYEVFESYRIEIKHHTRSRIGKDNYYYEYKSYSIIYIDEYLERWFTKDEITLYEDSGYTSNFPQVNAYQRFYDEENEAKNKAYKEYNKQDHFDCLMKWHYDRIAGHMQEIKESPTNQPVFDYFDLIGDSIDIKNAYNFLNSLWGHAFDYSRPDKERVKSLMTYGLGKFNRNI